MSQNVGLQWAIKRSFLSYVARMRGQGYVDGGASVTSENELVFPLAESQPERGDADAVIAFRGSAQFTAHGGLLYVLIADPVLTVRDDSATVTVSTLDGDGEPATITLATATLTPLSGSAGSDTAGWESHEVRLTAEGTKVFNEVYGPGELMAPLIVRVPDPSRV
jgi:hypothetical protein